MFVLILSLVISTILLEAFDNNKEDIIMKEYCKNECISHLNKKHKFCC